jgi:hypothetical protein
MSGPPAKIFFFLFFGNHDCIGPSRLTEEGRFAIVTSVEAGSGGRTMSQHSFRMQTNDRRADGQAAWSRYLDAGIRAQRVHALSHIRWPKSPTHRGERRVSRSNHCAGKAGYWLNLWFCRVLFCCTRTMGISRYPVFPAPSQSEGLARNTSDADRAARTRKRAVARSGEISIVRKRKDKVASLRSRRRWCHGHEAWQLAAF